MGPLKVFTDGSLNTRTACCDDPYPGLSRRTTRAGCCWCRRTSCCRLLRRAAGHGLDAAVHAIGDRANALALDAFAALRRCRPGRRSSTPSSSRDVDLRRFAELGVVASVQPAHALDDRDVADRSGPAAPAAPSPTARLLDAGARLVLGSDAPVAPLDPWITIAAAVHRSGDAGRPWHPEQEIPLPVALAASDGPRRPGPGRAARPTCA